VVLHLRPPCDHVACDLKCQGTASASLPRIGPRTDGRRESPAPEEGEVEQIKAGGRAEAVFSLAASYPSVGNRGLQGKVELAEA
jgi:hypothetical protein